MTEDQQTPDEDERARRANRTWKIVAGIMVVAAAVSMGVLASLLIGAGSSTPADDVLACIQDRDFTKSTSKGSGSGGAHAVTEKCPPKGAPHIDGLVQEATDTGFDLITVDRERKSFVVREADRPYIDIQHAQTHAASGQPVRIFTKEVDGEDVIVYMVDSPLRF